MIDKIESYYVENLWRHKQTEKRFCDEDDVRKLEEKLKQQAEALKGADLEITLLRDLCRNKDEQIKELEDELRLYKGFVI